MNVKVIDVKGVKKQQQLPSDLHVTHEIIHSYAFIYERK